MTDVFSLKVEELVEKIKDAQISSVELCQIYIDRINKFEKDIKAWAHFDKKLLLEKAAEADEHRRLGKPCLLYTSPSPRDMRRARMPSSA